MQPTLKIVRVFLASPGDLEEERRLANNAVNEVNKRLGSYFGFNVELLGWEDTLPSIGRPQELINRELDGCELFLGIMWKRWGTPPANGGPYTSGFEEEFRRSLERYKETGMPEIAMHFKEVSAELLSDPGKDLKKVIGFKKELIEGKEVFYTTFKTAEEFESCVRNKIQDYLINLKQKEDKELDNAEKFKPLSPDPATEKRDDELPESSPLSNESYSYLCNLLDQFKSIKEDEVSSYDIARFRLISNTFYNFANDQQTVGVHDANILFKNKDLISNTDEIAELVNCGLTHFNSNNTPLWHWINKASRLHERDYLVFKSLMTTTENICVGALSAMNLVSSALPGNDSPISREFFIRSWLSDLTKEEIKIASLKYLKRNGINDDIPFIQEEYDKNDSKTSSYALEAICNILYKNRKQDALEKVYLNNFEKFDTILLDSILDNSINLHFDVIQKGLNHKNSSLRQDAIKRCPPSSLDTHTINELKNDSSPGVRTELVHYLNTSGASLSTQEIRDIIIKKVKSTGLAGLLTQSITTGTEEFNNYMRDHFKSLRKSDLEKSLSESFFVTETHYLSLWENNFSQHADEVRSNIDDKFERLFNEHLVYLNKLDPSGNLSSKTDRLKESKCKNAQINSLDIICKKNQKDDINRVRNSLNENWIYATPIVLDFMKKHGEWSDLEIILNANKDSTNRSLIISYDDSHNDWDRKKAEVAIKLAGERVAELLSINMPPNVLKEIIKQTSRTKFSSIPEELLFSLLNKEFDDIRKFTAIKICASYTKSYIKKVIDEYQEREDCRYYNVIHWLDLGLSMTKHDVMKGVAFHNC